MKGNNNSPLSFAIAKKERKKSVLLATITFGWMLQKLFFLYIVHYFKVVRNKVFVLLAKDINDFNKSALMFSFYSKCYVQIWNKREQSHFFKTFIRYFIKIQRHGITYIFFSCMAVQLYTRFFFKTE